MTLLDRAAHVTDRMLLDRLRSSKLGVDIAAELQAAELSEREAWVAQITAIEAEREAALPPLMATREKAQAAVKRAEDALKAAQSAYATAYGDVYSANVRADVGISTLHGMLKADASPAIDELRAWLGEQAEAFRGMRPRYHTAGNLYHPLTQPQIAENVATRGKHLAFGETVNEARVATEGLKLLALSDEALEAKLVEIKATVASARAAIQEAM